MCFTVELSRITKYASGGAALRGNTRSHPEHDGKDLSGRWYCTGDCVGEQVAARLKKKTTDVSLLNINTGIGK